MKRAALSFLAGFLATLVFHQPVVWLFKAAGLTDRLPFVMKPVPPFGVPSVISLAFWGGVWGILMIVALMKIRVEGPYWITAVLFGSILPTLTAGLVIMPLRGQAVPAGSKAALLLFGLSVNAAWAVGTVLFYRLFAHDRR